MPEPGEEARAGRRARGKALDYDKLLDIMTAAKRAAAGG